MLLPQPFFKNNTSEQLLEFYQRNNTKYFDNQFNRIGKLNSKNVKGIDFFNVKQKTEYILAHYYSSTQPTKERNLEAFINALDYYTEYRKLTVFCDMLNHSLLTNYTYDLSIVNKFISRISTNNYTYPHLPLWKSATEILLKVYEQTSIDSKDYFEFKNQLFQEKQNLDNPELRNLVTYLRTILKRTNFEEEQYYLEQFSLYQFGLEHKIYFTNGYLNYSSVKNIITFAIRADQLDWLVSFLTNYRKYFPKEQAKELETYGLACIQFERKEYKNVITSLKGWEFKDIFLNLGKRILTIKVYYELEDVDLFLTKIGNLRRIINYYLDKQKITNSYSKAYLDFCSMILAIDKVIKKETAKINFLEQKVQALHLNKLPEKKWLLQKLNEKR